MSWPVSWALLETTRASLGALVKVASKSVPAGTSFGSLFSPCYCSMIPGPCMCACADLCEFKSVARISFLQVGTYYDSGTGKILPQFRTGYLKARRRLTANQEEDATTDMVLLDTVLQEQPLDRRDGYLGACLIYWRIYIKCRLHLIKYKPDADAVEAKASPALTESAKEARVEIVKRLVRNGNLLTPMDLHELFTARACLAEGYPVHEGRFADVHLNQEEALARAYLDDLWGLCLTRRG